jgi:hypothetical protein
MPINKKPFFIAFAAAPPSSRSFLPIKIILNANSLLGQFYFLKGTISVSFSYQSNQVFSFFSHFDRIRPKIRGMEPLEYLSDLFRKIGTPNFLMIGVVILILWLLLSGIKKGLRKGGREKERSEKNGED